MSIQFTRLGRASADKAALPSPTEDDVSDVLHFLGSLFREITTKLATLDKQTENVALRPYVDERLANMSAGFYAALEAQDKVRADFNTILATQNDTAHTRISRLTESHKQTELTLTSINKKLEGLQGQLDFLTEQRRQARWPWWKHLLPALSRS